MANVEASISLVSQVGILAIILLQDSSAVDPVTVQVFCTGADGEEYLAGTVTAQVPSSVGASGNRVAALADVPAGIAYRVVADNGASLEALALELVHGAVENVALSATVVPVRFERTTSNPDLPANAYRDDIFSSQQGAYLALVNQSDSSFFGVDVRTYSYTPSGTRYQIAQGSLVAPGGIGNRAAYTCEAPAARWYRTELWGDPAATLSYRYGETNAILDSTSAPVPSGGAGSTGTSCANVTYVCDENGDDATGERGNVLRPFKTIQAALDVSQDYDSILVAPGTYAENVVVPDLFLSIEGIGGKNRTRIFAASGIALTWYGTNGTQLTLRNLYAETADAGAAAMYIAGDATANTCNAYLYDVNTSSPIPSTVSAFFADMRYVYAENCDGKLAFLECNDTLSVGCTGEAFCQTSEPIPPYVTQGWYRFKACRLGDGSGLNGLRQHTNARVECDPATIVDLLMTDTWLGPQGTVLASGGGQTCDIMLSDASNVNLTGSRFGMLRTQSQALSPVDIIAQSATFFQIELHDSPNPGAYTNLNMAGGTIAFLFASSADPNCRVDLSTGGSAVLSIPPGVSVHTFANLGGDINGFAYPLVITPRFAISPITPPVPGEHVTITSVTPDGFTCESGYAAPTDCNVLWSRSE